MAAVGRGMGTRRTVSVAWQPLAVSVATTVNTVVLVKLETVGSAMFVEDRKDDGDQLKL